MRRQTETTETTETEAVPMPGKVSLPPSTRTVKLKRVNSLPVSKIIKPVLEGIINKMKRTDIIDVDKMKAWKESKDYKSLQVEHAKLATVFHNAYLAESVKLKNKDLVELVEYMLV